MRSRGNHRGCGLAAAGWPAAGGAAGGLAARRAVARGSRTVMWYRVKISAPSTQNSRMPSMVPVRPMGKPGPWSAKPALTSMPMKNDVTMTAIGL